jgi:uncharacterized protein with GYD domain
MPTYISLCNWTDQGIRSVKDVPKRLEGARKMMKDAGGELKAFYLTMGGYDFVTITEAPSDEAAAKVLLAIASAGNLRTTTLKAFDETQTGQILRSLG